MATTADLRGTMDDDTRPFPIQGGWNKAEHRNERASTIPWWLAEIAYAEYAYRHGNEQSLQRLADRSGFGRDELLELMKGALSE